MGGVTQTIGQPGQSVRDTPNQDNLEKKNFAGGLPPPPGQSDNLDNVSEIPLTQTIWKKNLWGGGVTQTIGEPGQSDNPDNQTM